MNAGVRSTRRAFWLSSTVGHMTTIGPRAVPALQNQPVRNSRSRLMLAASASILTLLGPGAAGLYGGRAFAQALPTGCASNGAAAGTAAAGDTVTCVVPPASIDAISTTVDDLTVVIGDGATPTAIQGSSASGNVVLNGNGDQTLNINSGVSFVDRSFDNYSPIVEVSATNGDLTIDNAATISGGYGGARADHNGSGSVLIDNSGTIRSNSSDAGLEVNANGSDGVISINNSGLITSNGGGALDINASAADADIVIENSGTITSTGARALVVDASASDADIVIENTGSITSDADALFVTAGASDVTITSTGTLSSFSTPALNVSGGGHVDISVGDVSSDSSRFAVQLSGADTIDFTSDGAVRGIQASNFGSATFRVNEVTGNRSIFNVGAATTSLTIESETAESGSLANSTDFNVDNDSNAIIDLDIHDATNIRMTNFGGGFSLSSTGAVSSIACSSAYGGATLCDGGPVTLNLNDVVGENPTSAAVVLNTETTHTENISVTIAGEIRGTVLIENAGAGDTIIDVNNMETLALGGVAEFRDGINVYHQTTSSGDIEITSAGLINVGNSESFAAIIAENHGAGGVTINVNDVTAYNDGYANDPVSTTNNDGVRVYTTNTASDVSVTTAGTVSATGVGVSVSSGGASASTTVSVNDVTSSEERAVYAGHSGSGDLSVTLNGTVDGGTQGVRTVNGGLGVTDITLAASAAVTGQGAQGILASSTNAASNITVQGPSGDVVGATDGIYLSTAGADITVQNLDSVTGQVGDGLDLRSGGGAITVSGVDTILGAGGYGVRALSSGGDVSIQGVGLVGGVQGAARTGINVSSGTGAINIGGVAAIGDVTGQNDGILAFNAYGGGPITINTSGGIVTGGDDGINTTNYGDGALSITTGNVIGQTRYGITATNNSNATNLSITSTGAVEGAYDGIEVGHSGSGGLTINVIDVTGTTGAGIDAYVSANATSTSITSTGALEGADAGVDVGHFGSGALSIDAVDVTSTAGVGVNVYASTNATATSITSTGAIEGVSEGVDVAHFGSGALTIEVADATGTGAGSSGLSAYASADATDTSITATGALSGGAYGAGTSHLGSGALTIDVVDVTGAADSGLSTYTSANGTDTSITSTGLISGATYGANITHRGSGALTIDVVDVTGAASYGVSAYNSSNGASLSITSTGAIAGERRGISAVNLGADLTISAAGSVTGAGEGIYAYNGGTGDLSITANNVAALAGGDDAIDVYNSVNGGALRIATTGNVTSADDDGIDAINYGTDLSINVSSGVVTGYQGGIEAYNYGSGATSVTVSGAVEGQTEIGVFTVSQNGASVTVNAGGSVTGAANAIVTDGGTMPGEPADDVLTINPGGSVVGDARLLAGADVFNDAGGSFTNVFGGDGTDAVNFTGPARTLTNSGAAGDSLQEFEIFNFNGGGVTLAGAHVGLGQANFNAGTTTLSGSLEASQIAIASGAELIARDGASAVGDLTNSGTLTIGDSPGVFTIDGDFTQSATGALPIEIDGSGFDQLVVTGDIALDGAVDVIFLGGVTPGSTSRRIIDGAGALSGDFSAVTSADGLLVSNAVTLDAANTDVFLTTTVTSASSLGSFNANQAAVGDNLVEQLANATIDPALSAFVLSVGAISDETQLAGTLADLQPEALDIGLKFLTSSQSLFVERVIDQSSTGVGDVAVVERGGVKFWGAVQGFAIQQGGDAAFAAFDGEAYEFFAGIADFGEGPVRFGLAGGYSDFSGDSDSAFGGASLGDSVEAKIYHLAASARADVTGLSGVGLDAHLDTVLSLAAGDQDVAMRLVDPVSAQRVSQAGEVDFSSVDWTMRFTVDGAHGSSWPVRPFLQAGVNNYRQDAMTLRSPGSTGLEVDELNNTRGVIGVGAAFEHRWSDQFSVRGQAAGFQYFGDTENAFVSRFANADGGPAFITAGKEVDRQVRLDAAAFYQHKSGVLFEAGLFGEVGNLSIYGARAGASIRF